MLRSDKYKRSLSGSGNLEYKGAGSFLSVPMVSWRRGFASGAACWPRLLSPGGEMSFLIGDLGQILYWQLGTTLPAEHNCWSPILQSNRCQVSVEGMSMVVARHIEAAQEVHCYCFSALINIKANGEISFSLFLGFELV